MGHASGVDDAAERCAECGFDGARWRVRDATNHLDALGWWWRHAVAGISPANLARRPAPAVWSVLEYGVHSASTTATLRATLERVLAGDAPSPTERLNPPRVQASPNDAPLAVHADDVLDDLEREGRDLSAVAQEIDEETWAGRLARPGGEAVRVDRILFHAVHDASHHQMDVGRGLSSIGSAAARAREGRTGRVAQINSSGGGVPKQPVDRVDLTWDGVVGDHQADRKHHGRPFQAVCLWSTDAIADLSAAGHHVFAGAVGENFTVDGLDWRTLRPGTRLRAGSGLLELSFPAVPCQKQAQWFDDRDFTRLAYENNPQWTRWYAWVREPGAVATDDAVLIV